MNLIKIHSITAAALLVAVVAVIACIVGIVLDLWWLTIVLVATAVYFTARLIIRNFVIFKIKPLYQLVGRRDTSVGELSQKYQGRDMLNSIQSELMSWAERNRGEIERLKENEQYRKEFVGNVSHELKTPLFSIQGYILTLLDGGLDDPQINRKYLEKTEKNIDRLIDIVDDLEHISKLETNSLVLALGPFDISTLVRELAESLEIQAQARGIRIEVKGGDRAVIVDGDRQRISQVVVNLLSNSIKYGRENGRTTVHFIDMFDRVMIEVQDDGIGIPSNMLPRIFERFFRVDKSRSREQGGTGLGLAIVKHIIEAHGQTITVRSNIGKGSTFSFTLAKPSKTSIPSS